MSPVRKIWDFTLIYSQKYKILFSSMNSLMSPRPQSCKKFPQRKILIQFWPCVLYRHIGDIVIYRYFAFLWFEGHQNTPQSVLSLGVFKIPSVHVQTAKWVWHERHLQTWDSALSSCCELLLPTVSRMQYVIHLWMQKYLKIL